MVLAACGDDGESTKTVPQDWMMGGDLIRDGGRQLTASRAGTATYVEAARKRDNGSSSTEDARRATSLVVGSIECMPAARNFVRERSRP